MKKLILSIMLSLAGSTAFAGLCELNCAGEQMACARSATNDFQQGMCRFVYNACMRDCGSRGFANKSLYQLLENTGLDIHSTAEPVQVEYQ